MDTKGKKQDGNASIFGSKTMRESAPAERIPKHRTRADIAYQIVKDDTAKAESGDIRYNIYGRLWHKAYERGSRYKLHR